MQSDFQMKTFSEQLDQFVERGAEDNEGAASLKPIVLKLVEALERYRYVSDVPGVSQFSWAAETLAEVSKMLEGGKGK